MEVFKDNRGGVYSASGLSFLTLNYADALSSATSDGRVRKTDIDNPVLFVEGAREAIMSVQDEREMAYVPGMGIYRISARDSPGSINLVVAERPSAAMRVVEEIELSLARLDFGSNGFPDMSTETLGHELAITKTYLSRLREGSLERIL